MSLHLATPDCAKISITFHHAVNNVKCEMTFAVQDLTGNIFSNAPTFCTDAYADWTTRVVPVSDSQVVYDGVNFEDVRSVPYGGAFFPQTNHAGTGAFGGVGMPTNAAVAVKKITGSFGRAHRGRIFFPIWNQAMMTAADTVGTTVTTNIATALTNWAADLLVNAFPATLGIISQQIGGVPRANGVFFPITQFAVADQLLDTQRRRLQGRGQ